MMALILATLAAALIAALGASIGLRLFREAQAAVEASLPQRMVDYCGFVPGAPES
jgi:hypothetical protein